MVALPMYEIMVTNSQQVPQVIEFRGWYYNNRSINSVCTFWLFFPKVTQGCSTFGMAQKSLPCIFLTKSSAATFILVNFVYLGTLAALLGIYCTYWIIKGTYYSTYNCILFTSFLNYMIGFMIWSSIMYTQDKRILTSTSGDWRFGCWFYLSGCFLQLMSYF